MLRNTFAAFLVLCTFSVVTPALAQHIVTVEPKTVKVNSSISLSVVSPTGLDLSNIMPDQVIITPPSGVGNMQLVPQVSGALSVQFTLEDDAPLGPHTLILVLPNNVVVSAGFNVIRNIVSCSGGQVCCAYSHTGDCMRCLNQCPRPHCPSGQDCCAVDGLNPSRCLQCLPVCPLNRR